VRTDNNKNKSSFFPAEFFSYLNLYKNFNILTLEDFTCVCQINSGSNPAFTNRRQLAGEGDKMFL